MVSSSGVHAEVVDGVHVEADDLDTFDDSNHIPSRIDYFDLNKLYRLYCMRFIYVYLVVHVGAVIDESLVLVNGPDNGENRSDDVASFDDDAVVVAHAVVMAPLNDVVLLLVEEEHEVFEDFVIDLD